MKKLLLPLCTFALALAGASSASATIITTPNLTVNSGGLTFSNFSCVVIGSGLRLGSCSTIDVKSLTPNPTGIQFSTNLAVLGQSSVDAALAFNVDASTSVNTVGLSFNSNFFGMDVNSVTEDIYTSQGGAMLGTMTVYCGQLTGCSGTTVSSVALNGSYSSLYVTKDINLSSFTQRSGGSASIITQSFTTATPEPVSMSLFGGGLALLGLAKLRKNKA